MSEAYVTEYRVMLVYEGYTKKVCVWDGRSLDVAQDFARHWGSQAIVSGAWIEQRQVTYGPWTEPVLTAPEAGS